jgi:hypothetical protein
MFSKPLVTIFQENSMKRSYLETNLTPGSQHFKKMKSIKVYLKNILDLELTIGN